MPNNTETYWEADGQSLHTYARSIETIGGMGPPKFRGDNIVVPLMPGAQYVQKVPDQNTLNLGMWLRGVDPTAGAGVTAADRAQFMKNYNDLIRTLWKGGKQFDLRKRFYDTSSGSVISATARAEFSSGLEPTMIGRSAGKCTVALNLADPFFYADVAFTVNLVNGNNTVVIPGNAPTLNMLFTINGSRTNTKIINQTNGIQFTTPEAIATGGIVTVNPRTYDAIFTPSGQPPYDVSSRIIHSGAYQWMQLEPGTNILQLSSNSGIGTVTLQAWGAWT